MTATILILTCLAMMHFIYESIILPSIRLSLRFKLFALRDQLRSMVMQGTASNEVFRIQQSSINNAINMLSWADQAMISRFERQLRDDEAMRKRVEKRVKIVEDYDSEEFQRVVRETSAVFQNAVIANMGAWFVYIVPIGVFFLCLNRLKCLAREMVSIPEGELGKVVEQDVAFA